MKSRAQKREEAAEQQARRESLTTQQKYDRAVARGHHDTREAKRLRKELGR